MTTGSPVSRFGVKDGLCLPRSVAAACVARRPSTAPSASMTRQWRSISLAFALLVLFTAFTRSLSSPVPLTIFDPRQTESPCRRARSGLSSIARPDDLPESLDPDLAASHPEERPDDRPDHAPEERVGLDLEPQELALSGPLRPPHGAHHSPLEQSSGLRFGALAVREGPEVAPSDERGARLAHRIEPQRRRMVVRPPLERIAVRADPKPVFICASRCREPRVELVPARLQRRDRHVVGKEGVDPPSQLAPVQRARRPEADDLSDRVDPRVRPSRAGDPHRLVADRRERRFELALYRPRAVLDLEAGESGPVVGDACPVAAPLCDVSPSCSCCSGLVLSTSWRSSSSSSASWARPRTWRRSSCGEEARDAAAASPPHPARPSPRRPA